MAFIEGLKVLFLYGLQQTRVYLVLQCVYLPEKLQKRKKADNLLFSHQD